MIVFLHEVRFNNPNINEEERMDIRNNRVVLLFDFWHPDLVQSEIDAIKYCLPPIKNSMD